MNDITRIIKMYTRGLIEEKLMDYCKYDISCYEFICEVIGHNTLLPIKTENELTVILDNWKSGYLSTLDCSDIEFNSEFHELYQTTINKIIDVIFRTK